MTRLLAVAVAVAVAALTGCQVREIKRDVVTVNSRDFLCSHTENRLSGNESDPNCTPIDQPTTEETTP